MLSKTRRTLAVALAASAIGAAPAAAMPADSGTGGKPDPRQLDMHASTVVPDARGENAASIGQAMPSDDLRTADSREPVGSQPVVVEVSDPAPAGFDWTAAIIGLGAGLALAVLAGVGVTGTRRRQPRTV
jgi:hypothetical protein